MSLTADLYGSRRSGISHGDVFTSPAVVSFILDIIGYTPDKDLSKFTILEPSFGEGAFLQEIQRRICVSASTYGFDPVSVMNDNVYGCEIDPEKYRNTVKKLQSLMPLYTPCNLKNEDFLLLSWSLKFDFIVGNPPYVRYENIPSRERELYKKAFHTFHYRCDLYILFYELCLRNLSLDGKLCFISSNRWLKNEYGKKLRQYISAAYSLDYIIDIEQVNAFSENVLAYPSIILVSNTFDNRSTKMASVNDLHSLNHSLTFKEKKRTDDASWDSLFTDTFTGELHTLEQQGLSLGIGVATGADKILISTELPSTVEPELLLPIINAKDLSGNSFSPKGLYLLNPYLNDGSLIELERYPLAAKYLSQYKEVLENRHIVKNCGRKWYALIDKVKPDLKDEPKILLPDISGNNVIFVDEGQYYPAHNIYYITGKPLNDLYLVAAILMSDFIKDQISGIANKMNGGLPRWQIQSIKKLRLPKISAIPQNQKSELIHAYLTRNLYQINKSVDRIVSNGAAEKKGLKAPQSFPKNLFDYDFSQQYSNV